MEIWDKRYVRLDLRLSDRTANIEAQQIPGMS